MEYSEINSKIELIERDFPVDLIKVSGQPVWQMVKTQFYYDMYQKKGVVKSLPVENIGQFKEALNAAYSVRICGGARLFSDISSADVLLLSTYDMYRSCQNGYLTNSIYYDLRAKLRELNLSVVNFLPFNLKLSFYKYEEIDGFYDLLPSNFSERPIVEIDYVRELLDFSSKLGFDRKILSEKITRFVSNVYELVPRWTSLLKKINPKSVIFTSYRASEKMAMVCAASKLGIRTIEYQHGLLDGSEYSSLQKADLGRNFLPERFWVWGSYTKKSIAPNNTHAMYETIQVSGKLGYERKNKAPDSRAKLNRVKVIGIFHQYTTDYLIEDALKLNAKLRKNGHEVEIVIRLHPRSNHLKEIYRVQMEKHGLRMETGSDRSLIDFFEEIDWAIAETSTVALEAADYGLPVTVIGRSGYAMFRSFIDSSVFGYAESLLDFSIIAEAPIKKELNYFHEFMGAQELLYSVIER